MNKAILLGRIGKKETKPLKNGGDVTILSIATNKKYKDAAGQAQEITTWHNVNCFSKLSEIAIKYVHVGDLVLIQGEIQNKKVESGERAGQFIYSIHANDIEFIPKASKKDSESKPNQEKTNSPKLADFVEDDIPF